MTFDDLRALHPQLGFAAYAYEPGGAVMFEVHAPDGQTYEFTGPTLEAAIEAAFPPAPPAPMPDVLEWEPAPNVFD